MRLLVALFCATASRARLAAVRGLARRRGLRGLRGGGSGDARRDAAWARLEAHVAEEIGATHLRELLRDESRNEALVFEGCGVTLDLSRQRATRETLALLVALADACDVGGRRDAMMRGEKINASEGRAVLHTALRAPRGSAPIFVDGVDVLGEIHDVLDRVFAFAGAVRGGVKRGVTGEALTQVVVLGIGGSALGPECAYEALRSDAACAAAADGRLLRFVANVDPVDAARALEGLDAAKTLVVVVSKSFTTAETLLNAEVVREWLEATIPGAPPGAAVADHVIAVSSEADKAAAFGVDKANVFGFGDYVGGRFSVHSPVGALPLALHFGAANVKRFLSGARKMDDHFATAPLAQNLPVLLGLFGLYNSAFLGHGARAVLPYAQALSRFPAHVQQLDMESNGKRVAVDGSVLDFAAGELVFGEPGTNGQHSFYQLMHQGRVVPAEFLGFCESQRPKHVRGRALSCHDELMTNFFAQPDALACGSDDALNPERACPGNRPSLSVLFPRLDPEHLGALFALYEHRVAVQGFLFGINSFDQWGVQLGKVLASKVADALLDGERANGLNSSTRALVAKYKAHRRAQIEALAAAD